MGRRNVERRNVDTHYLGETWTWETWTPIIWMTKGEKGGHPLFMLFVRSKSMHQGERKAMG